MIIIMRRECSRQGNAQHSKVLLRGFQYSTIAHTCLTSSPEWQGVRCTPFQVAARSSSFPSMQCASLARQLLQASRYGVLRSFSTSSRFHDSLKPPEAVIDSPSSQIFLSSPLQNGTDTERRFVQAKVTAITPVERTGSENDDYTVQLLADKLKKVDLCKRYNLQPRDVSKSPLHSECT